MALAVLIMVRLSWQAKHTLINGQRGGSTGTEAGLCGHYIKLWPRFVVTLGVYSI